jgi:adenosine/AMP kinase
MNQVEIKVVDLSPPEGAQLIVGQAHFIKTVEDLYETLATSSPSVKFGVAFCESSGPALVRFDGNDSELTKTASEMGMKLSAGHSFIILLRGIFPLSVLNRVKWVEEVATVYCATGNPVRVLIADVGDGRAVLGVADGIKSKGLETDDEKQKRKEFLRKIGYKR